MAERKRARMSKVDLKVVLLGQQFGGKTSLVDRYLHDRFTGEAVPYQNTIGAAYGSKKITVLDRTITVGIWDTAGSERYESMSRIYYRGAKAAVVCYDLTDDTSFDRAVFWVKELKKHEEGCKIYLCGTKDDLIESDKFARKVDYHTTTDFADEIRAEIFETSSKTGHAVDKLFQKIAEDFVKANAKPMERISSLAILNEPERRRQRSCCWLTH